MTVHLESIYGFYHGQDPRTFFPDEDSCSEKELETYAQAVKAANDGTWQGDNSGCHHLPGAIICTTSMGIGVYQVVMAEDGEYVRDARFEDLSKGGSWEEADERT